MAYTNNSGKPARLGGNGNNNFDDWNKIEQSSEAEHYPTVVSTDLDITQIEDTEIFESQEEIDNSVEQIFDAPTDNEDFGEVLNLTEYQPTGVSTDFVIADYNKIDVVTVSKVQERTAKSFIGKVTKFILDFNDIQLTENHKKYIQDVAKLQLNELADMLTLMRINKEMINNIVARVNSVQAEDYALINSYNNLVNQHIKISREVATIYKNIPATMKKMRADILSNQELEGTSGDEVITENYGETQFNSSKQLLKSILKKRDDNLQKPDLKKSEIN